ncbi:MAG: glutamate synthase-related protein [Thermodesulfobacteriota bacterium]
MPAKYHIPTSPAPPRQRPVGKLGIVEWREDCSNCHNCVKRNCVYGFYREEADALHREIGFLDYVYQCKGCLICVQNCTKGILTRVVNPEYERLGDDYYTPEIIQSNWYQAETGSIPVSGAGYGGPFSGPGFDSMWTDMSEIVRPTRDGIHGREYINTSVDIGRKHGSLRLDGEGFTAAPWPLLEIPLPILFDILPSHFLRGGVARSIARAAARIGTLFVAGGRDADPGVSSNGGRGIPVYRPEDIGRNRITAPLVILPFTEETPALQSRVKRESPNTIVAIRMEASHDAAAHICRLTREGIEVVELVFDAHGREQHSPNPRHMRDVLREVHRALTREGTRDQVTLIASGGIAQAEHVAKAIICGADLVAIDLPLMIALECRLCGECERGEACPIRLEEIGEDFAVRRIVNLMAAWRNQLLELLGAMGIREVRRLRGETGRAMFFEDLEAATFGRMFGKDRGGGSTAMDARPAAPAAGRPEPGRDAGAGSPHREVRREPQPAPPRYRNAIGKFRIHRDSRCVACGRCVELCPHQVHKRPKGYRSPIRPLDYRCIGFDCARTDHYCVAACPAGALSLAENPAFATMGDCRWTPDLLASTWAMAETGRRPPPHLECETGASGGGFDRLRFRFLPSPPKGLRREDISTELLLNRRGDGRPRVKIDVPWYGGGMSFGSTNIRVLLGKVRAAGIWNSFSCTGEGGYPERFIPYADHMITQVATGLFGVREETVQRARIVEFKYAQGAKPGLGGHLLGDKNTPEVAAMREAVVGTSLFSPFPFHSVYSIEDHKKHLDWIAHVNPRALLSAKVSTPADVDMVAVGVYCAGAHIVHIDGSYGGTGAAPNIAKKNIAMPIEYAINQCHQFLTAEGVRDEITLMASGGIRTPADVAKAIALGADGVIIGTAELVAVECIRCGACESGRGCPRGICTTDNELLERVTIEWCTRRIANMYNAWREMIVDILYGLGLDSVSALRGRTDLLRHLDYV